MAQIITDVKENETFNLTISKKYKCDLPAFGMISDKSRRTKVEGLDMHNILQDLSKGATWIFWEFVNIRNPKTNKVKYLPKTTADRSKVSRAYPELNKVNLIKRIKQGEYIINPRGYLPKPEYFNDVDTYYKSLP